MQKRLSLALRCFRYGITETKFRDNSARHHSCMCTPNVLNVYKIPNQLDYNPRLLSVECMYPSRVTLKTHIHTTMSQSNDETPSILVDQPNIDAILNQVVLNINKSVDHELKEVLRQLHLELHEAKQRLTRELFFI